ncbi:MAG: gliding motility-associated C-terminal domain-containing protein [Cyclobacteriaceae bacterium]
MIYISRQLLLIIFFLLLFVGVNAQITSTFNSNAQGWTTPMDADATIGYSTTGGNPNGHVFGTPYFINLGAGSIYFNFYFVAPSGYLGNRSAYYNGTLRYDIQQSTSGIANQYAEVTIASGAGVTLYYYPTVSNQPSSPPLWSTFIVIMNNTLGFWKTADSPSGPLATELQIQNVLSDLTSLQIRGLYRDANTTNRLDNVALSPPIIIATQPSNTSVCQGVSANLITLATNNPSITYQWQRFIAGVGYVDLSNDAVYSGVTSTNLSVDTSTGVGAGSYRCRISGTNVVSVFTNIVSITVNTPPLAPGVTGASSCGPSTVALNASGGSAGQYRWYSVSTGGTPIAGQTNSTYTTPVIAGTTTYYVSINNGTCESARTSVTATINTIPSAPGTTGNASCGSAAISLNASGGSAGQYRWYTVSTGGTPIAGQTNSAYTTPVIAGTTTYYVSINNGTCESTRTPVVATINSIPTAPGATGNASCGSAAISLNASGGSAGQYRWYTVSTGGTPIAGQTNSAYTTPVIAGTTTYYVSINNGTCESARTSVTATINTIPSAPGTTGNASCGSAAISLNASGGSAGQYRWYTVSTGGTPIAGQTNSTYMTPAIAGTTTYYVSINNGTCESTRTPVVATINSIPTAPGATGNAACGSSAITLNASGGLAGQYRWYTVSAGGTPIAGEIADSYTTPLLNSTTPYYVSLNDGICESERIMAEAIINPIPSPPVTTGASNCEPGALILSAAGAADGEYVWYDVPSGGTPFSGEVNSTYTTPVLNSTTTYYAAINNGLCESSRQDVTATIGGAACTNSPPQVDTSSTSTTIAGVATIDLTILISDPDNNLDLSTLKILVSPISNAIAQINNMVLTINYSGLTFSGRDRLTIEICDLLGSCTQQEIIIDVGGYLNIYSGISPNSDLFNEKWIIQNIESLPETKSNHVSIFNRWGDVVFEVDNYDNNQNVFIGLNKSGDKLSSGIYFYKIEFSSGLKTQTGYLTLKH